jgi:hypothetical protein
MRFGPRSISASSAKASSAALRKAGLKEADEERRSKTEGGALFLSSFELLSGKAGSRPGKTYAISPRLDEGAGKTGTDIFVPVMERGSNSPAKAGSQTLGSRARREEAGRRAANSLK